MVEQEESSGDGAMTTDESAKRLIGTLVQKIRDSYHPDKIILFGSYAYGTPDRDSDLDLLIIKETKDRPIDRRVAVARILSDPKLLIPVELLVLTPMEIDERLKIGDQFLKEIVAKGDVLYAA